MQRIEEAFPDQALYRPSACPHRLAGGTRRSRSAAIKSIACAAKGSSSRDWYRTVICLGEIIPGRSQLFLRNQGLAYARRLDIQNRLLRKVI